MIIDKFGEQLVPHAAMLVQKLCESFLMYASDGVGDSGDDEACMAATQCMDAVTTVYVSSFVSSLRCLISSLQFHPNNTPALSIVN